MKKIILIITTVLLAASVVLVAKSSNNESARTVRYFSPNNDGNNDVFKIPLKITDKRYVMSWQLIIENEIGNIVRVIGNKEALPETLTFKQFWKQLGSVKKGVAVPNAVEWNGAMDNGEAAPDGMYYYYFTAKDDNGNETKTDKFPVVVDTVPPLIDVNPPNDKIFGEGDKTQFPIAQTGSNEDLWTATIRNTKGDVIRTYKWEKSEPASLSWNGTDEKGLPVSDGVYSYEVSSTDRAGNSTVVTVNNIIFSADKPVTSIALVGSKFFSPGTDSPKKDVSFKLSIPLPKEDSGNKLVEWSVKIVNLDSNAKGSPKPLRTFDHTKLGLNPPATLTFDGKDDKGTILGVGRYQALVSAKYLNGFIPDTAKSGEVILDTIKPNAALSVSNKIFGAGAKTKTTISILTDVAKKLANVTSWKAKVVKSADSDAVAYDYDFGEYPPDALDWDGFNKDGKLCEDAKYTLVLTALDAAGNSATITSGEFELNTKAASVFVTASEGSFSPLTASAKKNVTFTPFIKDSSSALSSYTFEVKNAFDEVVKKWEGTDKIPATFLWDGKDEGGAVCEDNIYTGNLTVTTDNGAVTAAKSTEVTLDTKPPYLEASTQYTLFSPDGNGRRDTLPIDIAKCTSENTWHAVIKNSSGQVVRSLAWTGRVQTDGKNNFIWDARDDAGNLAADGGYTISFDSTDEAGNTFSTTTPPVTIDTRETKAYITTSLGAFCPNGNGSFDTEDLSLTVSLNEGLDSWTLAIKDEKGNTVRTWSGKDKVDTLFTWDGKSDKKELCEGTFTAALNLEYTKGNSAAATSAPFICTTKPPELAVKTTPTRFSPDNDGTDDELFIKLSGKSKVPFKAWTFEIKDPKKNNFWTTKGTKSITSEIKWDGLSNIQKDRAGKAERVQSATDYPYTFTVTDTLGMTSSVNGLIPIDILVIRDGNLLKMAVPSIIFRSDNADFKTKDEVENGIDPEIAKNNEKVLKRVAEVLNKFKEYKITIVGHANRVTDNEKEETEDNPQLWGPALIPLSGRRAEFVKAYLKKRGVSLNRMTTEGKGGTQLIVDFHDKDNNWKNRRVEFILQK